jgi:hypothetical protein
VKPRQRPELIVRVPLEGEGRIILAADTLEDGLRLRSWLRRCGRLDDLAAVLIRLLDDLDEHEEAAA